VPPLLLTDHPGWTPQPNDHVGRLLITPTGTRYARWDGATLTFTPLDQAATYSPPPALARTELAELPDTLPKALARPLALADTVLHLNNPDLWDAITTPAPAPGHPCPSAWGRLPDLYETKGSLRSVLLSIGIAADQLTADDGGIVPDDQHAGEGLASAITRAVRSVTGGGSMDADYCPYCRRCGEDAAIRLGSLRPQVAQRLAVRLQEGAA
jgi:hypothetical protein